MSFKTKALGLAAATALSLSIVSGAMAADGSGSASVKLVGEPGTGCTIASVAGGSFADSTWTGGAGGSYSTPNNVNLTFDLGWDGDQPAGPFTGTCNASIKGTNFSGTGTNTATIGVGQLSYNYNSTGKVAMSGTSTQFITGATVGSTATSETLDLSLNLSGVNVTPDTYTSDLTITVTH